MDSGPIIETIRESFGRVVYTHKTHEKDRERFSRFATTSKTVNIALCALTFGGALTALGGGGTSFLVATVFLSTLSAAYALFQLSFDPQRTAERHRSAAKSLLVVRNDYENLLADAASGALTLDEIRTRRDELESQASDVYKLAPDTSSAAYSAAQKALGVNEDMTFSNEEINRFLPAALHHPPPSGT